MNYFFLAVIPNELVIRPRFDSGEVSAADDDDHADADDVDANDSDSSEHCYPPGKLRASKSIGELCHALNAETIGASNQMSVSPCPPRSASTNTNQRPAVSLAALCDVSPEEAPSSHRLIAQWEHLIQQRQEVA